MLIFALALAAQPPAQLTDIQQRDIACVGVMALIANDQHRKAEGYDFYPDVQEVGKKWAGIVGERIMEQTGLPKEVVGVAMTEAAKAEQNRIATADEPMATAMNRFIECQPLMEADLPPAEMAEFMGVDWGTDEPAKLARMHADLAADRASLKLSHYCTRLLRAASGEVTQREGKDSRDAKAIRRLSDGMEHHIATLPLAQPGELNADDIAQSEEQMARCIRLGQWAATRYRVDQ